MILAGWLHDVGAVEGYEGHEERSVEKAEKILRDIDVSEEGIDKTRELIKYTDVSLEPKTLPHKIMQDADAAFIGKDRLLKKLENMWKEFKEQGKFQGTMKEFLENSISLYQEMQYYTETARKLFDEKMKENIEKLKRKVRSWPDSQKL